MLVWMPRSRRRGADARLAAVVLEHDRHHVAGGALDARRRRTGTIDARRRRPAARGSARVSSRRRVDVLLEARQAREQQRRARLVEAVVEAEADDVVGVGAPAVAVPGAAASSPCERRERASAATSSLSVHSRPPSPTERTLLEKKLNAPARPQVPSLRPVERRARGVRDVLDQREPVRVAELRRRSTGAGVAGVVDDAHRLRARRDAALDVLGVEARVVRAETISANTGVAPQ